MSSAIGRDELLEAYALDDRATPRIRMNFVMSLDGAVTLEGRSGPLGDASDRLAMAALRALADVILVGAGTVRVEGYGGVELEEADVAWRRAHGLPRLPRLAVASSRLDLGPEHAFFSRAAERPIVVTHESAPADRRAALAEVADVITCGTDSLDARAMVRALADAGMPQVLCEGGPRLFGALLDEDLVDELCLSLSPTLVGGDPARMVRGAREAERRMRLVHAMPAGDLLLLRYARSE